MVYRLPPHILNELVCRIQLNEPPTKIMKALHVGRATVYRIRDNLDLYGVPYPPEPTIKPGRLKVMTSMMADVRNALLYSVIETDNIIESY